jgi:hypothetical protein
MVEKFVNTGRQELLIFIEILKKKLVVAIGFPTVS